LSFKEREQEGKITLKAKGRRKKTAPNMLRKERVYYLILILIFLNKNF